MATIETKEPPKWIEVKIGLQLDAEGSVGAGRPTYWHITHAAHGTEFTQFVDTHLAMWLKKTIVAIYADFLDQSKENLTEAKAQERKELKEDELDALDDKIAELEVASKLPPLLPAGVTRERIKVDTDFHRVEFGFRFVKDGVFYFTFQCAE